jgi:hypothetical protein
MTKSKGKVVTVVRQLPGCRAIEIMRRANPRPVHAIIELVLMHVAFLRLPPYLGVQAAYDTLSNGALLFLYWCCTVHTFILSYNQIAFTIGYPADAVEQLIRWNEPKIRSTP